MSAALVARPTHPALFTTCLLTPPYSNAPSPNTPTSPNQAKHALFLQSKLTPNPTSPLNINLPPNLHSQSSGKPPITPTPLTPLTSPSKSPLKAKQSTQAKTGTGTGTATGKSLTLLPPVTSYPLLRAMHVYTLKYVIAKLRWDQTHNGYIRGLSAWREHDIMIDKLEAELVKAQAAQKGYDRFPNAYYAWAEPKPHGPKTKEQVEKEIAEEVEKERFKNEKLNEHFPFIRQLFIGPMTKVQARYDKAAREDLWDGYLEDMEHLLEPENVKVFMAWLEGGQKPMKIVHGPPPGDPKAGGKDGKGQPQLPPGKVMRKMTFEEKRMAREKNKIDAELKAKQVALEEKHARAEERNKAKEGDREKHKDREGHEADADHRRPSTSRPIGPITKEQYISTLPTYGPKTKEQAMLAMQREHRQLILAWLRKPWAKYDAEAAGLIRRLGGLAMHRLQNELRGGKEDEGETGNQEKRVKRDKDENNPE